MNRMPTMYVCITSSVLAMPCSRCTTIVPSLTTAMRWRSCVTLDTAAQPSCCICSHHFHSAISHRPPVSAATEYSWCQPCSLATLFPVYRNISITSTYCMNFGSVIQTGNNLVMWVSTGVLSEYKSRHERNSATGFHSIHQVSIVDSGFW